VANLLEKLARVEKILNGSTEVTAHNRPRLFEEER
jgi:hypothetical protein